MFRHHAGEDPLDQLAFMSDQGFRGFEDNDMKKRPVKLQEKMGRLMADRDMQMGVFVAHTIAWSEPNLASGDPVMRGRFLDEIRESVEVAQRVGATWMTVVPGHLDLRQSMGYQTSHVVESLKRACEIHTERGFEQNSGVSINVRCCQGGESGGKACIPYKTTSFQNRYL